MAAARKVSPAASMTLLPSSRKRLASFAIVVVLPTPLTPTIKITKGWCWRTSIACSTGSSMVVICSVRAANSASADLGFSILAVSRSALHMRCAGSTPRSAIMSWSSISSYSDSSSLTPRLNSPDRLDVRFSRVLLRRPNSPPLGFSCIDLRHYMELSEDAYRNIAGSGSLYKIIILRCFNGNLIGLMPGGFP